MGIIPKEGNLETSSKTTHIHLPLNPAVPLLEDMIIKKKAVTWLFITVYNCKIT